MRKSAAVILLAGLTAACGEKASHVSGTPSPSATTAGGHGSGEVLIATAVTPQSEPGSLTLYSLSGTRVAQFQLDTGTKVLAVAGSRVFIQRATDHLKAIRRDGTVEDLGSLGQSVRWFAASPDGTRWIWSTSEETSDPTHSAVHLGGDGLTARVVEELTRTATVLGPLSWTRRGAFVQYGPAGGHGGYFPFGRFNEWLLVEGSVHQMDPVTGHITALPATFGCSFGDMAADGTIICFPGGAYVRLVSSGGMTTNISLATPRFNNVGEAFCSPTEATCTVAGATGVGNAMDPNHQPEQYGTDLVTTDGSISRFGPEGVDPAMGWQSWLPNGSLVLWRRPGAAGGPPGLYVLDKSGHGPFIGDSGEPVGYLN
jgi:hypothetical protein